MQNDRIVLATVLILGGCAAPSAPPAAIAPKHVEVFEAPIKAAFDTAQAERLSGPGQNTIQGSALMRTRGGSVVSCAGLDVELVPATDYAKERMGWIYGSDQGGIRQWSTPIRFTPSPAAYDTARRHTTCDAQGAFTFDQTADGSFYVVSCITWSVAGERQGNCMMRPVTVSGGKTVRLVIAP